jgi:hypothetical protein
MYAPVEWMSVYAVVVSGESEGEGRFISGEYDLISDTAVLVLRSDAVRRLPWWWSTENIIVCYGLCIVETESQTMMLSVPFRLSSSS